jgi:hypothetical protein
MDPSLRLRYLAGVQEHPAATRFDNATYSQNITRRSKERVRVSCLRCLVYSRLIGLLTDHSLYLSYSPVVQERPEAVEFNNAT